MYRVYSISMLFLQPHFFSFACLLTCLCSLLRMRMPLYGFYNVSWFLSELLSAASIAWSLLESAVFSWECMKASCCVAVCPGSKLRRFELEMLDLKRAKSPNSTTSLSAPHLTIATSHFCPCFQVPRSPAALLAVVLRLACPEYARHASWGGNSIDILARVSIMDCSIWK